MRPLAGMHEKGGTGLNGQRAGRVHDDDLGFVRGGGGVVDGVEFNGEVGVVGGGVEDVAAVAEGLGFWVEGVGRGCLSGDVSA